MDASGQTRITIAGKWNESFYATVIPSSSGPNIDLKPLPSVAKLNTPDRPLPTNVEKSEGLVPIWISTSTLVEKGGWTLPWFAHELNSMDDNLRKVLPKTDSRIRPDRLAWEGKDLSVATEEKKKLEQRQRDQRKIREQKGEIWKQRYCEKRVDADSGEDYWHFGSQYWDERELRAKSINESTKPATFRIE